MEEEVKKLNFLEEIIENDLKIYLFIFFHSDLFTFLFCIIIDFILFVLN